MTVDPGHAAGGSPVTWFPTFPARDGPFAHDTPGLYETGRRLRPLAYLAYGAKAVRHVVAPQTHSSDGRMVTQGALAQQGRGVSDRVPLMCVREWGVAVSCVQHVVARAKSLFGISTLGVGSGQPAAELKVWASMRASMTTS